MQGARFPTGIRSNRKGHTRSDEADIVCDAAWRATEKLVKRVLSAKDQMTLDPGGPQWRLSQPGAYLKAVARSAAVDLIRESQREHETTALQQNEGVPVSLVDASLDGTPSDAAALLADCYRELLASLESSEEIRAVALWFMIRSSSSVDASVQKLALEHGASSRTVYRWFSRGEILVRRWAVDQWSRREQFECLTRDDGVMHLASFWKSET
jgi:hypothetical protein